MHRISTGKIFNLNFTLMSHLVIDFILSIVWICATKINEVFTYLKLLSSLTDSWTYSQDLLSAFNLIANTYVMHIVGSHTRLFSLRVKFLFRRFYYPASTGIECVVDGPHVGTVFRQAQRYQAPSRVPATLGNRDGLHETHIFPEIRSGGAKHRPELSREMPNPFFPRVFLKY